MKYFTRELKERYASADGAVADAADAEWETALERYEHYLASINSELPEHIRTLNQLLLHDAIVWSIARDGTKLIIVMRKNIPPRELVILTYTLTEEPVIDRGALPAELCRTVMDFQYDEFELLRQDGTQSYAQSIVFGNGWEMTVRFSDVRVTTAEPVYLAGSTNAAESRDGVAVQPA